MLQGVRTCSITEDVMDRAMYQAFRNSDFKPLTLFEREFIDRALSNDEDAA